MKTTLIPLLVLAALLATGCASSRCGGDHEYQQAASLPPAQKVEGLKTAESPSALKIPPAPATSVPYAEPTGDDEYRCLDLPPPMQDPEPAPKS